MQITEIRLTVSKTVNLGNFNSIKIEGGLTAHVSEGEDLRNAKASLQTELRNLIEETYRAQKKDVQEHKP